MLNRLISISTTIAQGMKMLLTAATKYLIGDGFYETATAKAEKNTEGVGVIRFGPPKFAAHVCFIQPCSEPGVIYEQLKQLMNLDTIDARHTYACVNFITGSDFFLSMHGTAAIELRKKLIRHFDLNRLHALTVSLTEQFLQRISQKKTILPLKKSYIWFEEDIKNTIFRLFAHGLCGFELDADFSKIKLMIEQLEKIPNDILSFYVFFPQLSQRFHPTLRQMRKEYDSIITQFIKEQIQALQQQEEQEKTIFTSRIAVMYPDCALQELKTEDIEFIAKDRQIRTTISGLLAINNITRLILSAIRQFELTKENVFYSNLINEIDSSCCDKKSFMNKETMPLLHAFYLEMLRHQPPMPAIARYARNPMQMGSQKIPANSLVIFDLRIALLKCGGETYNARGFYPERYLNQDGTLNKLAKKSQQVLLPFGAGTRMCPAMTVSEMLFKTFLIAIFQDAYKNELITKQSLTPSQPISVEKEKKEEEVLTHRSHSLGM